MGQAMAWNRAMPPEQSSAEATVERLLALARNDAAPPEGRLNAVVALAAIARGLRPTLESQLADRADYRAGHCFLR